MLFEVKWGSEVCVWCLLDIYGWGFIVGFVYSLCYVYICFFVVYIDIEFRVEWFFWDMIMFVCVLWIDMVVVYVFVMCGIFKMRL